MNYFIVGDMIKSIFVEEKIYYPIDNYLVIEKIRPEYICQFDGHIICARATPKAILGEFIDVNLLLNKQIYINKGKEPYFLIPDECTDTQINKEQKDDYNNFIETMAEIFSKVAGQY